MGLAGLASAVNSSMVAWAQTAPSRPDSSRRAASAADTSRASAPQTPSEPSEEARELARILGRRYGKHLNAKQLEAVTREIDGRLQGGKRLREVKLANHDEPDFTFRA
jgi:hypothetical protein